MLSIAEASNPDYGFDAKFDSKSETREAKNTDYAIVKNAGEGEWWLRSPGGDSCCCVSFVSDTGWGCNDGSSADISGYVVRPALHINLSSALYTDAGEVTSDGSVSHKDMAIQNPTTDANGVTTWDCVYFGNYKQTAKIKKEPIEWRVLSVDGDDAFLLADQNLDCQPYNEEDTDVTWETCSLRQWLNKDFYEEAFNESEREAIQSTTVVNEDNQGRGMEEENDTTDKVYLLSIAEASNPNYGFDVKPYANSKTREAKNTDYAKMKNAYTYSGGQYDGNGCWWLRSPGFYSNSASYVTREGECSGSGTNVDNSDLVVRPALHINLSSAQWSKVGEVSTTSENTESEPTATPTNEPTKTPGETANPTASPIITPTQSSSTTVSPLPSEKTVKPKKSLKVMKLSSIRAKKNTKKITGKVSVSKAVVKIKVGKKAYKKATVKGKKFTLKVAKLKKKTKITIKVTKKGYRTLKKKVKVK